MAFRDTQNPGIGGLDELTLSEETTLQTIASLGSPGEILRTNLAGTAVEWTAAGAGSGDVVKVGTPVNNQVGVWTGDGTLEGDTALTFDTATDTLGIAASGIIAFGGTSTLYESSGSITLESKYGGAGAGAGGDVTIHAANGGDTSGNGGTISLESGASNLGAGGNIDLRPRGGTTTNGNVRIKNAETAFYATLDVGSLSASRTFTFPNAAGTITLGTGTGNEIAYWSGTNTIGALAVATYPSLTELSYVKGVTSGIQSQINAKGTGDVSKVGTPADNQIGVWTGDGTIEGDTAFTFDTSTDTLTAGLIIQSSGNNDLTLQTGNATTGTIKIIDGADGNIVVAPNGASSEFNVVNSTSAAGEEFYAYSGNAYAGFGAATPTSYIDAYIADNSTALVLKDGSASTQGPYVETYLNSASPAANDVVGEFRFNGEDSAGNKQQYAAIKGITTSPTSTSEVGQITFAITLAGNFSDRLTFYANSVVPVSNDTYALGSATNQFSDLFLAEGGVINWDNGDATLTQTGNVLKLAGAALETDGNIELGHASDTTLSRVSAGVVAIEGNNIITSATTATRTLVLTAAGGFPSTTAGCAANAKVETTTNDLNYYTLDFDDTTQEHAEWTVIMPDSYDGGTVTAVFFWTSAAGSAGESVRWGIQARAFGDDDALDQAFGTAQEVQDDWIADGDVHVTSATSAITIGGTPAGGKMVQFKVYRDTGDAADDHTGDAKLMLVKIEYGINAYSD